LTGFFQENRDAQAWQLAHYRGHATSDTEAYQMIDAGERIRRALATQG